MVIRLVGLALVACSALAAFLFIYLPVTDPGGFMGSSVRMSAIFFVPLALVSGVAFLIGGGPVLWAFQARPRTKAQLAIVLGIIIGAEAMSGVIYWQLL